MTWPCVLITAVPYKAAQAMRQKNNGEMKALFRDKVKSNVIKTTTTKKELKILQKNIQRVFM